jgi:hypothetical protein
MVSVKSLHPVRERPTLPLSFAEPIIVDACVACRLQPIRQRVRTSYARDRLRLGREAQRDWAALLPLVSAQL